MILGVILVPSRIVRRPKTGAFDPNQQGAVLIPHNIRPMRLDLDQNAKGPGVLGWDHQEGAPMRILLAVDGSECSLEGVRNMTVHARWYRTKPEVDLVNVQPLLPYEGRVSQVMGRDQVERYYREEGDAALARAAKMLGAAGIEYRCRIFVGPAAETVAEQAKALRCDLIVMGAYGRTPLGQAALGSVALKVLHIAEVPVQLVRLTGPLGDGIFAIDRTNPASADAAGRQPRVETRACSPIR